MKPSFWPLLGWEARLQAKSHIFTANAVSTAFIAGFVALVPSSEKTPAVASFFVFADPALLGLSFVGAVVMMERAAGITQALGVTPLGAEMYLAVKAAVLTATGTLSGVVVALFAGPPPHLASGLLLIATLVVSNLLAVLVGFALAARARSMNHFIIRLLLPSLVLFIPLLTHFSVLPRPAEIVLTPIPSTAMLWLLRASFTPQPDLPLVVFGLALLAAWLVVALRIALKAAREEVLADAR